MPFTQKRICKFRTMTVLEDGPTIRQATRNDTRITRVGRLIVRSSIDELPQLFKVLMGDMSLVAPCILSVVPLAEKLSDR
jgi:lipopolysaccharide/colanic/teichoic acid biosynthesis glycosyltransferase